MLRWTLKPKGKYWFGGNSQMCEQWNHIFRDKMTSVLQKGRRWAGNGPQTLGHPLSTHTSYVLWTNTEAFTLDNFKIIKKRKCLVSRHWQGSHWSICLDSRKTRTSLPSKDLRIGSCPSLMFCTYGSRDHGVNQIVSEKAHEKERLLSGQETLVANARNSNSSWSQETKYFIGSQIWSKVGDFGYRCDWIQEFRGCHRVALSSSFFHLWIWAWKFVQLQHGGHSFLRSTL